MWKEKKASPSPKERGGEKRNRNQGRPAASLRKGEGALHGPYPLSSFSPGCPPIAGRKASKTWYTHHTSRVSHTALMCEYGVQQNRAQRSFLALPYPQREIKDWGETKESALSWGRRPQMRNSLCSASSTYSIFCGQHSLPLAKQNNRWNAASSQGYVGFSPWRSSMEKKILIPGRLLYPEYLGMSKELEACLTAFKSIHKSEQTWPMSSYQQDAFISSVHWKD